jgi:methyl-accepting chemotaxis protein
MIKGMKLGHKLLGGFLAVAVITLIVGGIGFVGSSLMMQSLDKISKNTLPSIQALYTIQENQTSVLLGERSLLLAETRDEVEFQTQRLAM